MLSSIYLLTQGGPVMHRVMDPSEKTEDHTTKNAYRFFKRLFDIIFSALMLLGLSPVLLVLTVIVAIDTKGSPFFTQLRMGQGGKPFRIYKFRSMSVNAPADVATHKLENPDQYISKIGNLIRKTSVDELPQLINVLKGDMSFIGPRPVVLAEEDLITLRHQNGADRVRPGITGLAQIRGRDNVIIVEKAAHDAEYANTYSLKLDLKILFITVKQVLKSEGIVEGANDTISGSKKK